LTDARFAAGDRVICAEWLGKAQSPRRVGPESAPPSVMGAAEYGYPPLLRLPCQPEARRAS
jgi:hypothetical protein